MSDRQAETEKFVNEVMATMKPKRRGPSQNEIKRAKRRMITKRTRAKVRASWNWFDRIVKEMQGSPRVQAYVAKQG